MVVLPGLARMPVANSQMGTAGEKTTTVCTGGGLAGALFYLSSDGSRDDDASPVMGGRSVFVGVAGLSEGRKAEFGNRFPKAGEIAANPVGLLSW